MSTDTTAAAAAPAIITHRTLKLPALGTHLPHLGGAFWAMQRARPGAGLDDYALIVPGGPDFEVRGLAWGGYGVDEPGAACHWDGQSNTEAMLASEHHHPVVEAIAGIEQASGLTGLYLPALREIKALHANGCDQFGTDVWYLTSTQFSRNYAFHQVFVSGTTYDSDKSWEGAAARFVRRVSLDSLIP